MWKPFRVASVLPPAIGQVSLRLLAFINWDDHLLRKLQHNLDRATSLLTTFQWFRKNKTMVFTRAYKLWPPATSPASFSGLYIHWPPRCYSNQLKPLLSFA